MAGCRVLGLGGLLLRGCRFLVRGPGRVEEGVDVLVEGGVVAGVGRGLGGGCDELDCRDAVVAPALVNAHCHAAMWVFRGLFDTGELHEWLSRVWRAEARLERRVVRLAARAALMEMAMAGTAAVLDMYYFPEELLEEAGRLGLRAYAGPVITDRALEEGVAERLVRSAVEAASKWPTTGAVVNVHSPYTASAEAIGEAARLAERYGLRVHIHVSETRREVFTVKRREGVFPVEYLERLGVLGGNWVLVHLGWVTSWEIGIIRRAGATAVHCPASNMKLATAGFFPLREMLDQGVNVALGTDGPASNNALDMFREMRVACLLQRNNYWRTDVGAEDVFRMATVNGYRALGLEGGVVDPGLPADLVVLDARSPRLNPLHRRNVLSNLVYSATGADVRALVVGGRVVYRKGETGFEEEIPEIARELGEFVESIAETLE